MRWLVRRRDQGVNCRALNNRGNEPDVSFAEESSETVDFQKHRCTASLLGPNELIAFSPRSTLPQEIFV
jgi:hypothetical protein